MTIPFNSHIFVLTAPIVDGLPSLSTNVFIEFDSPVVGTPLATQKARWRSIGNLGTGTTPEWSSLQELQRPDDEEPLSFAALPQALTDTLIDAIQLGRVDKAMCALTNEMAQVEDAWDDFRDKLQDGRFEVSAWFERDRKHVSLTDGLTSCYLVNLWDDDVDEAIESGYLSPPKVPRARDSDWLEPLLDYARETGALEGLSLDEKPRANAAYAPMRA